MTTTTEPCRAYPHSLYSTCQCPKHRAQRNKVMKLADAGLLHRVPVEEAWAALDRMVARGHSLREIADAAGINSNSLYGATGERKNGHTRALHPLIRSAIVRAEQEIAPPGHVYVIGSARRLRALAWLGWRTSVLTERTGLSAAQIQHVRTAHYLTCLASTAALIARVYDDLWDKDGGCPQSKGIARARGWHPPLAWDDETIDDPAAEPWTEQRSTAS